MSMTKHITIGGLDADRIKFNKALDKVKKKFFFDGNMTITSQRPRNSRKLYSYAYNQEIESILPPRLQKIEFQRKALLSC